MVGADGLIGASLARRLERESAPVLKTSRRSAAGGICLDLAAPKDRWEIPSNVEVACLCAAITSTDYCRRNPVESRRINVEATLALSQRLHAQGARIIFLSSNQVFDGTLPHRGVDDATCPRTEYGRQKVEVEQRLLELGGRVSILRLTKVLAPGNLLLAGWLEALGRGAVIHPFRDMVMAPVALDLAIDALVAMGRKPGDGVFQLSAARDISYEEAARCIAARIGASADLILPISAFESMPGSEWLPKHTTLDGERLRVRYSINCPEPQLALQKAVSQ